MKPIIYTTAFQEGFILVWFPRFRNLTSPAAIVGNLSPEPIPPAITTLMASHRTRIQTLAFVSLPPIHATFLPSKLRITAASIILSRWHSVRHYRQPGFGQLDRTRYQPYPALSDGWSLSGLRQQRRACPTTFRAGHPGITTATISTS